jgi:Mce-associated membrane protein
MAEENDPQERWQTSKADAIALAEEAEAEAVAAEALAVAAQARARAARLRRKALKLAAAESAEEATAPEPEAEPEQRRRRWMPVLSVIGKTAAMGLIVGFALLSGYMLWQHRAGTQRVQRAAAFTAGAKRGVVNMTSLDFNRAKDDVQRVIDCSTGQFRDDFVQRAAAFTTVVQQSKVVTEGTVTAAAVESMDDHSALVLVSATSRITNSANTKEQPKVWRLRVTVTEDGGQYKMSKVEYVA